MSTRARRPSALTWTLTLIVLLAVVAAGALGWMTLGTDAVARHRVQGRVQDAKRAFDGGHERSPDGAMAILRSTRLGIEWPVVEGVERAQLEGGALGWYPGTTPPGQPGNTAIAGLRVTHGSPFRKLLELRVGDVITLQTEATTFRYVVKAPPAHVDAGESGGWVLDPVPGGAHRPTTSILTLTTNADLVGTDRRAVVFAEMQG